MFISFSLNYGWITRKFDILKLSGAVELKTE